MSRAALQSQHESFYGHQRAIGTSDMTQSQRPSRLMQMREDYQQRLMKEKEDKMVHMYEDTNRKNMQRAERVVHGGVNGAAAYPNSRLRQPVNHSMNHPEPGQMGSTPSVRDFFRERRQLEAKGGFIPPISQHYNKSRNRTGSGSSQSKNSAGVDRANPLAPIQARHSGVSSAPTSQHNNNNNVFNNRSRLPGKSSTAGSSPVADENDNFASKPNSVRGPPPARKAPSPTRAPPPAATGPRGVKRSPAISQKEEKVTDFQKWQNEQNKAREDRLKKLNMRAPPSARESSDFGGGEYEYEEEEDEEEGNGQEDEIARQQRELMEKIAQQQAELDRLRKEREQEEVMERQEAEMRRKQEAADKERRRKQKQEEARRRREEEAETRREKAEQRKATAAAARERQQEQQHYDDEEESYSTPNTNRSDNSQQPTPRNNPPPQRRQPPPPPQPQRRVPPPQRRAAPQPAQDFEEEEFAPVPGPGIDLYAQAAEGEQGGRVRLVPCKVCGRKFADDRVQKHQSACKIASKPRKVYDPTKMRTEGTDMAKYISKGAHKKEPKSKKKADWRRQHEEFINNIRYAKKVTEMEKQGMDLKDLPPPPPSHNPDLVACPHCNRTFNSTAAERHIPRCQGLKTKAVPNRRR
ncbi:zinc finger C2HC domain-containing protein 1C-like isoform X2 [Littorina saxatilis]|uniref:C2HC/C3H-type domain-containing protein n=1 Tax=Littorina saxatilis TaxID=31220 RepID=A0AAN9GDC7_9CAEN